MKRWIQWSAAVVMAVSTLSGALAAEEEQAPLVKLETSSGDITLKLFPEKAPKTVTNFLNYVDEGHYDNTVFHRVILGFMVQGGGFDADLIEKPKGDPIPNESRNRLH